MMNTALTATADRACKPRRFKATRTVLALILREMATTHGRSPLGYLWAVIEPVAAVALLSLVLQIALSTPPLGTNFPLFYATGYLVYATYASVSNKVALAVRFSRPLLEYPAVTALDTVLARFLLNMLTQMMVFYIVLGGIVLIFDLSPILSVPSIALSFLMTAVLTLGIGTLNCYLFTAFEGFEQLWSVAMKPAFLLSGILFLYDDVPAFWRDILWYNPLIHITGEMRAGFYGTYGAPYVTPAYVFALGLGCFALGLLLLRRHLRAALLK